MTTDLNRLLIETTVHQALKTIRESPERTIRNLVDLGVDFSRGRFQKRLMVAAQTMLGDQKSAYYALVKDAIDNVDTDILTTFGINLGYNGCTRGARTIRAIEAERGFNIPWSLALHTSGDTLAESPEFYPDVISQGMELGIHTYLLFTKEDPTPLISLVKGRPECAFLLFLRGETITDAFIQEMRTVKNAMLVLYDNEDMPEVCQKLREARLLYGVYLRYTQEDRERIVSGQWLDSILPFHPAFAFLRTEFDTSAELQEEIYRYILSVRVEQRYPLIAMDLKRDDMVIDAVISDGVCVAGFDEDGCLRTHEGIDRAEAHNLFRNRLEDIFASAMRK